MFPLIETAIAFAAAMLAASLFVSAVVHGLQGIGQYRSEIVERMLKSVFHGFRSFYNDDDVLAADHPEHARPKRTPEQLEQLRARVLVTAQEFVRDVLSDPSLHARSDGASYGGEPAALARMVEYIDAEDLVTIARNHAESAWVLRSESPDDQSRVSSPSTPPPVGEDSEAKRLRKADAQRFLPAEWFFPTTEPKALSDMQEQRPYATVAKFAEYVERWFPTFEASASETFKKRIRRLTLVVSCTAVVLFNLDGFHLAASLYRDSGARASYAERVPQLQAQAARLGVVAVDVQPDQPVNGVSPDLSAEVGSLLSALDDPSLALGWQGSPIVGKWCAYTGKCPSSGPAISGRQVASATFSWLLGLIFSCVMLSMGAPFWYKTLAGFLSLRNAVQTQKQEPEATTPDAKKSGASRKEGSE